MDMLQRYRRDRSELLSYLLSSSLLKKVAMPPGAVSLEDLDMDVVSVDHVLQCCRKGLPLDLAAAVKQYHAESNLPLLGGQSQERADLFYLLTHPDNSGPPPGRLPPAPASALPLSATMATATATATASESFKSMPRELSPASIQSRPSPDFANSAEGEVGVVDSSYNNPFDSADEEEEPGQEEEVEDEDEQQEGDDGVAYEEQQQPPPMVLNDATDVSIALPPFVTGLTADDLREAAYELLLASVGAAGGLVSPAKEPPPPPPPVQAPAVREEKMRLLKRFGKKSPKAPAPPSSFSATPPPPSPRPTGLAGLMETLRIQLQISTDVDKRTRDALLRAAAQRGVGVGVGRMDAMLVPLELLAATPRSDFPSPSAYSSWALRQLSVLEEGLLHHPLVKLEAHDAPLVAHFKSLCARFRDAERLQYAGVPGEQVETVKAMRQVAVGLAQRGGSGGGAEQQQQQQQQQRLHWADGYCLNVRLYQQLLARCFPMLADHRLEEAEEILEVLKSTWRNLGMTQGMHDVLHTWVLFHHFVATGAAAAPLLQDAVAHLKRVRPPAHLPPPPKERDYMATLRAAVDTTAGLRQLSLVQSVLLPLKQWVDKRLACYHSSFPQGQAEGTGIVDALLSFAMIANRLLSEEDDYAAAAAPGGRMSSPPPDRVVCEEYIRQSMLAAYHHAMEAAGEVADMHPLATLAEEVRLIMERERHEFSPALSRWHAHAEPFAASCLHALYGQDLRPFLEGVTVLTDDVEQVLPAADSLDQYLLTLAAPTNGNSGNAPSSDDGSGSVASGSGSASDKAVPFEVSAVSGGLIMRWVNSQLAKMNEWVDRTVFTENWEAISPGQRHGSSIVDVFRIIEETLEQFFALTLPMRMNLLKGLATGIDSALQQYATRVLAQLGSRDDLIPPVPQLTRYKRDVAAKAAAAAAKKGREALMLLPDGERVAEIQQLSTVKLCVRLNSLQFLLAHLDQIEDSIRERWALKRPQDDLGLAHPALRRKQPEPPGRRGGAAASKIEDLSLVFDPARRNVNNAIDKICDFAGTKVVFWDMRDVFLAGLYRVNVVSSRIDKIVLELDPVLGELCEVIAEPLRDRVVLGLLQACLSGLLRVLLDGGPARIFAQSDSEMLEEDLVALKDFFVAEGDGLPRTVVENTAAQIGQILNLYSLETSIVIDSYRRASESSGSNGVVRGRSVLDSETLLRVLCHRADREASKFLKKVYKLPKVAV